MGMLVLAINPTDKDQVKLFLALCFKSVVPDIVVFFVPLIIVVLVAFGLKGMLDERNTDSLSLL